MIRFESLISFFLTARRLTVSSFGLRRACSVDALCRAPVTVAAAAVTVVTERRQRA